MDNQEWLQKAKDKINTLPAETTFEAKELFNEVDWKHLQRGDRLTFGRFFANECREGRIPGIIAIERGKNNHSKYKKIGVINDEAVNMRNVR